MVEPSDSELFQAYCQGDQRALEILLRRYEKPLFTFMIRLLGDRDEAEDVFQETLTRVVENLGSYSEQGRFGPWLFGIAHHLCVDHLRDRKRWKVYFVKEQNPGEMESQEYEVASLEPLPNALLEQKELKAMIVQALQHLSPEQREVFLLRQHSDLTFREIAEMVHRPLNTVLSQMRLAMLSIRKFLQEKIR